MSYMDYKFIEYNMKSILFLVLLFVTSFAFAQEGVKWETSSFNDALNKAAKEKKYVFLDCYTSWCGPCKLMLEREFVKKEAGKYFNKKFVNIKMDMEKGEGIELAKKYKIRVYPTFIVINAAGDEIGRVVGRDNIESFIVKVEQLFDEKNSPEFLRQKYLESRKLKDAYIYLDAVKGKRMTDETDAFFREHADSIGYAIYTKEMWPYVEFGLTADSGYLLERLCDDYFMFIRNLGYGLVSEKLTDAIVNRLSRYLRGKQGLSPEVVSAYADRLKFLAGNDTYKKIIVKASLAMAKGDIEGILKAFDANTVFYDLSYRQGNRLKSVFVDIPLLSKEIKRRYFEILQGHYDWASKRIKDRILPDYD